MADQTVRKTVEQLKNERTAAKRSFTRLANSIIRTHDGMSEDQLQYSFNKLSMGADKVMETNDEVMAEVIAVKEAELKEEESVELTEQQEADIARTTNECELKLKEVGELLRDMLWQKFGDELCTAVELAEAECERVARVRPDGNHEAYEFMLSHLKSLVGTAKEAHCKWQQWVPVEDQKEFRNRLKEIEREATSLVSRKAEFIMARRQEDTRSGSTNTASHPIFTPTIRLKPTALPRFSGYKRDFHRWRRDWESLQKQGEPTGSKEVKKIQLLDSLDDRIKKDFHLTTYNTADDILRVLENRYGNRTAIAIEIVEDLQKMSSVRSSQPRKIVELIQAVEKALWDLSDLGDTGAIKNPLVTKSIESKLPESLKKEWLVYVADPKNGVTPEKRFDYLLAFLKQQETIYEELEQLRDEEPSKPSKPSWKDTRIEQKSARTKSTKSADDQGCVVCGDVKHKRKLYFCKQFRALRAAERKASVKKLGACTRCLEVHDDQSSCKPGFLCRNEDCRDGEAEHHYYLCPKSVSKRSGDKSEKDKGKKKYTEGQEDFIKNLPPDLAKQCREAFSNVASRVFKTSNDQQSLLEKSGMQELPVIMMLLVVTANAGQKVGTLIDLASDTNYITHRAASRLDLKSEDIMLVVHGVGGMKVQVKTKRYLLKIRVSTPKGTLRAHQLVCYGLDNIADVHKSVTPEQLQPFFPDVPLDELVRPKEVELLISHREGQLAPQRIRVVGDLVLWDGPLGRTVGGTHPRLFEEVEVSAHMSKTHFARSMRAAAVKYEELTNPIPEQNPSSKEAAEIQGSTVSTSKESFLKWWQWDSIGAACEPRCGGCRCGNCQPGGKEMTLAEERELEVVKDGLTYVMSDDHSREPHWHAKYPWLEDPASLPNNRGAVEATFLRTEKQLAKAPEWKSAYKAQVHDMVDRGAAIKLTKEQIMTWKGPVWFVSHLIAPNPHSTTTPVRLVWNSSQKFRGTSMNDLLMKGPDVLNQIRAVLLRFRGGTNAALGDIRKMYNSVWLEDREMHLHRFLWRDSEDKELEEYAITRVNIGDKPAGCIAQLAMRETANLPPFAHLEEEREVLQNDSYVDDILTSHNDFEKLKTITANVEQILKAGGFLLKPWVFSGQSGRKGNDNKPMKTKVKNMVLPNQMRDEDNKALGLGYLVEEDKIHVMASINFSKRKKKMHSVNRLQKKTFVAALTRAKAKAQVPSDPKDANTQNPLELKLDQEQTQTHPKRPPAGSAVLNLVNVKRFSNLSRLVKTVAWIWRAAKKFIRGKRQTANSPKWEAVSSSQVISVKEREDALRDIFLAVQQGASFPSTTTDRLVVYRDQETGLLVCGGRVQIFNEDKVAVPILSYEAWVSTLLAREAHEENHDGVAGTLLKMRRRAWVVKGRRIAQKVVENCMLCRKTKAKRCQQIMGDLPPERTEPAAPFEYTTVDLFGPYQVKDDVKKRVSLKVWGVVFCCMASRAIHTELVNSQSTESFLFAYQRFTALRGHPKKIWSDPGTNFVGAKPVLEEQYRFLANLDKATLEERAAKNGTEWTWKIHPADSPHRNGAAEAAVRIIKRALQSLGGESGSSWSEFQTTLYMAANLTNGRPIDARTQSREDSVQFITPNCLLLGRASQSGDVRTFDFSDYPYKRLKEMQAQVNKFWRHWSQLAGPNLFVRNKWHTAKRNVAVGDIVWIADQNALRGQFRIARVVSVNSDSKGIVRDVNVRTFPSYPVPVTRPTTAKANHQTSKKLKEEIPATVLHRDVRRLVVLLPTEEQNKASDPSLPL
ncbi:uncharacterized protein LOC117473794 isoform X2 [Trematomus bernacchii]|uniref:uncharacterized protein LOC117473794 isoform X2 n=1 Tax=Trematomus bernacchii TaxID=40690 RepID=UPI00146C7A21|nr:uncharacterized protein LOC117473794 isoform X2 [Trematomus bernacchii]